jgi:hypothetical protein
VCAGWLTSIWSCRGRKRGGSRAISFNCGVTRLPPHAPAVQMHRVRSHDFRAVASLAVASMPKQKSSAQIHVADGAGGMRQVADLRFEAGEWPIELVVPAKDAETWMAHLNAETEERGWHSSSFSQLDTAENSGTLSVHTANGPSPATLDIVWDRPRGKELRLRARPSGDPVLSLDVAHAFINSVSARVRTGKTLRAHRQALLTYEGLPWRRTLARC